MPGFAVHLVFVALALPLMAGAAQGEAAIALDMLTVPADRLAPAGCQLTASDAVPIGGNRFRGGLWAGLPISSNPWIGSDPRVVAAIRERVLGSPRLPDGPPPSAKELARMRLAFGDDVEKAYAAVYADDGSNLVVVYALTFKDASDADLGHRTTGDGTRRFHVDGTTVVVSGEPGGCAETVGRHIDEVIRR